MTIYFAACVALLSCLSACAALSGRPPAGSVQTLTAEQKGAIAKVRAKLKTARIVWSSSRAGNHDLYLLRLDGSATKRLTQGKNVDWYPRFSPDGKRILFVRSKRGWVSEMDANRARNWNQYVMPAEGGAAKLVAKGASWGTWLSDGEILYSRATKVFRQKLDAGAKPVLVADSKTIEALGGADLQNPNMSPDGKFLAITLRGRRRETGVLDLAAKTWVVTGRGAGCQIGWFPSGDRLIWVNPSGNGGSELFSVPMTGGKLAKKYSADEMRFMDIPGRRSHEYFPKLDRSGKWLVWAATRRGHDHDIADYELYIWNVGTAKAEATRLTFHSANDRWPDIYVD